MEKQIPLIRGAKFVTQLVTSIGVGIIAGSVIATVPVASTGVITGYCVKVGAAALEGCVTRHVVNYVGNEFDDFEKLVIEGIEMFNELKEQL